MTVGLDELRAAVAQQPDASARELARKLRAAGYDVAKSDINPLLYANQDRVFARVDGSPPRWTLMAPLVQAPSVDFRPVRPPIEASRKARRQAHVPEATTEPGTHARPATERGQGLQVDWNDLGLDLRHWQREALEAWWDQDGRGVVEAVTGTGKTHVGIAAVVHAAAQGGQAVILVPSIVLQEQWRRRLSTFASHLSVSLVGGGAGTTWNPEADAIIAVINTAAKHAIVPRREPSILVADEVHRYGAPAFAAALRPQWDRRLGLSATFERDNDDGVRTILEPYFGDVAFRYDYLQAVPDATVAPFRLALAGTELGEDDRQVYEELTARIGSLQRELVTRWKLPPNPYWRFMLEVAARAQGVLHGGIAAKRYQKALRDRQDLLSAAPGKIDFLGALARDVMPGRRSIVFTSTIQQATNAAAVLRAGGISVGLLHSKMTMDERSNALADFEGRHTEAIVAPRILDEGVDVAEADLAIVLSGSRTKRQMIQRFGRVLRQKDDGREAALVIAYVEDTVEDPDNGAQGLFLEQVQPVAVAMGIFTRGETASIGAFLTPSGAVARRVSEPLERAVPVAAAPAAPAPVRVTPASRTVLPAHVRHGRTSRQLRPSLLKRIFRWHDSERSDVPLLPSLGTTQKQATTCSGCGSAVDPSGHCACS